MEPFQSIQFSFHRCNYISFHTHISSVYVMFNLNHIITITSMTGTRELATNPSDSQKEQDSAGGSRECAGTEGGGGRRPAGSWANSTTGTGQEDVSRPWESQLLQAAA